MIFLILTAFDLEAVEKGIKALEGGGEYRRNPSLADSLARLYVDRCTYLLDVSDCERAISIYERYVENSHLKRSQAVLRKAHVQKNRGEYEAALISYREAIGELGRGVDWAEDSVVELRRNLDLLISALGNYYLIKGLLALQSDKYDEAISHLDVAIRYLTSVGGGEFDLAHALHARGVAHCRMGETDKAIAEIQKAVQILKGLAEAEPNNEAVLYELGMAYFHLGNAYLKSGKRELAAEAYEKAAAAFMGVPGWEKSSKVVLAVGRTYIKHAEALHKSKKFAEAVKYYKKGIKHLKRANRLCRKEGEHCPTREEMKSARAHLDRAKRKKEFE